MTSTPDPASTPIPDPIPHHSQCIGVTYKDGFPNYAVLRETEEEEYEIRGTEFAMGAVTAEAEGLGPRTIEEAKKQADWPMWEEAIQKELDALHKANTWDIIE